MNLLRDCLFASASFALKKNRDGGASDVFDHGANFLHGLGRPEQNALGNQFLRLVANFRQTTSHHPLPAGQSSNLHSPSRQAWAVLSRALAGPTAGILAGPIKD